MLHAVGLLQGLSSIPLLPMTSKKREKKKGNLAALKSFFFEGKLHLRAWVCFSFLLSSFSLLIQYSLALQSLPPPSYCPVSSPCLCSYLSFSRLWLRLCSVLSSAFFFFYPPSLSLSLSLSFSLPLVSSLWGSCGSERHFGARLRQYFTLIKRMVGSTVGAAQEHFFSR